MITGTPRFRDQRSRAPAAAHAATAGIGRRAPTPSLAFSAHVTKLVLRRDRGSPVVAQGTRARARSVHGIEQDLSLHRAQSVLSPAARRVTAASARPVGDHCIRSRLRAGAEVARPPTAAASSWPQDRGVTVASKPARARFNRCAARISHAPPPARAPACPPAVAAPCGRRAARAARATRARFPRRPR